MLFQLSKIFMSLIFTVGYINENILTPKIYSSYIDIKQQIVQHENTALYDFH